MKLVAITALWQRPEVSGLMLDRLERQNIATIAVGSEGSRSRHLAESHGARYVEFPNAPLGDKWNRVLVEAAKLDPDGVVVLGSDNFVTAALFDTWTEWLADGVDYMGVLDGYIYDRPSDSFAHWKGYTNARKGEPLGSARCFSRGVLDRLKWQLWEPGCPRYLDHSATRRLRAENVFPKVLTMGERGIRHLGVKTATNMGRFEQLVKNNANSIQFLNPKLVDEWFGPQIRKCHEHGGGI